MEFATGVTSSVRTEGGLLPADLLAKIVAGDLSVPGLDAGDFGLAAGVRTREAITGSWNRLVGAWASLEAVRVGAGASDALVGATRERFLLPLFEELGFGRVPVARAVETEGRTYPISHRWTNESGSVAVPIHLVGYGVELDARTPGVRGAAGAAPHALVQDYLNRAADALWGLLSNGRTLRLLRDSSSLTRAAFVEFDLEAIFAGELYADFALLWTICHRSRFNADKPEDCLLERWSKKAADDGIRALDRLRDGVERAIETLGVGFLSHRDNEGLRAALRSGALDRQDYYRELLRLVYRLILLFTAEERRDEETGRELLLDPTATADAVERYRAGYSMTRLRRLAARRRGTRHRDLWVVLQRVINALGASGAPSIALPALGSFLFGVDACPHLDRAVLGNDDLLAAVRALTTIEEDRRLRAVDYRNLGAEELGSVYEGLLELQPRVEMEANPPRFTLSTAAGNERKSSGSYYTPSSLITYLLDFTLDPVIDEAVTGKASPEAEVALLGLSVVDPAAGSGHFLVAAARRLATRLAAIRTGEAEPTPPAIRHGLREVIAHCIYAVDVNPMAVELCKVSLWLEALDPGKPFTFLDSHIKCGNSLLGATPDAVESGIPDAAYDAVSGDNKEVAKSVRRKNASERSGQRTLFEEGFRLPIDAIAAAADQVEGTADDDVLAVRLKEERYRSLLGSSSFQRAQMAANAWSAAFVLPKVPGAVEVTSAVVRALADVSKPIPELLDRVIAETTAAYGFFHWHLEFPDVLRRGGFDVVLGNPPWEKVKLQEKEFFASRQASLSMEVSATARRRSIANLADTDPNLHQEYLEALHHAHSEAHLLRGSGRYPLAARGDLNTFALFVELMRSLARSTGRVGTIVPTGIATDEPTSTLFADLVARGSLVQLVDFENRLGLFPGIHRSYKFSLLTLAGDARRSQRTRFLFYAQSVADTTDPVRWVELSPEELTLINPLTRTVPLVQTRDDLEILLRAYRAAPPTLENRWFRLWRDVDSSADAKLLLDAEALNSQGWVRDGATYVARGDIALPVYEGKSFTIYDHRAATIRLSERALIRQRQSDETTFADHLDPDFTATPYYWVREKAFPDRVTWAWVVAFKKVTSAINERTLIATVLPRAAANDSVHLVEVPGGTAADAACLLANMASLPLDFVARQKLGGLNFNFFVFEQLPLFPPAFFNSPAAWTDSPRRWIGRRVAELVYTAWDVREFARALGWTGPPFVWDEDRRSMLQAELDAAFLHFYGLSRTDASGLLDSFRTLKRRDEAAYGSFRTKERVLSVFDRMLAAADGRPFVSSLFPEAGDPSAAHRPSPGDAPGVWTPPGEAGAVQPRTATRRVSADPSSKPSSRPPHTASPSGHNGSFGSTRSLADGPHRDAKALSTGSMPSDGQRTLEELARIADGSGRWVPEDQVDFQAVTPGHRVRHPRFGVGLVVSVAQPGKAPILTIRFGSSEPRTIAVGYHLLEFEFPETSRERP